MDRVDGSGSDASGDGDGSDTSGDGDGSDASDDGDESDGSDDDDEETGDEGEEGGNDSGLGQDYARAGSIASLHIEWFLF